MASRCMTSGLARALRAHRAAVARPPAGQQAAAEREVGAVKMRMWLIISPACRSASIARVGIFQTLASKRRRGASGLPLSRADLYR